MNFLFNKKDIMFCAPDASGRFFDRLLTHVFTEGKGVLEISLYMKQTPEVEFEELSFVTEEDRQCFASHETWLDELRSCFYVILDIQSDRDRIAFCFDAKGVLELSVDLDVEASIALTESHVKPLTGLKDLTITPNFNMILKDGCKLNWVRLNNIDPRPGECMRDLWEYDHDFPLRIEDIKQQYKEQLLFNRTVQLLNHRIGFEDEFINTNQLLMRNRSNIIEGIAEHKGFTETAFSKEELAYFTKSTEHFTKEYDAIISRGLKRIEELS